MNLHDTDEWSFPSPFLSDIVFPRVLPLLHSLDTLSLRLVCAQFRTLLAPRQFRAATLTRNETVPSFVRSLTVHGSLRLPLPALNLTQLDLHDFVGNAEESARSLPPDMLLRLRALHISTYQSLDSLTLVRLLPSLEALDELSLCFSTSHSSGAQDLVDCAIVSLMRMTALRVLRISHVARGGAPATALPSVLAVPKSVMHLSLNNCQLVAPDFECVAKSVPLTSFAFAPSFPANDARLVRALTLLAPSLRHLDLTWHSEYLGIAPHQNSSFFWQTVGKLTSLRCLTAHGLPAPDGVGHLSSLRSLHSLTLRNIGGENVRQMSFLAHLTQLTQLTASFVSLRSRRRSEDAPIAAELAAAPSSLLSLSTNVLHRPALTADHFLTGLTRLTGLHIHRSDVHVVGDRVDDSFLVELLESMPRLRALSLEGMPKITSVSLKAVAALSALRFLRLSRLSLFSSSVAVEELAAARRLEVLDLGDVALASNLRSASHPFKSLQCLTQLMALKLPSQVDLASPPVSKLRQLLDRKARRATLTLGAGPRILSAGTSEAEELTARYLGNRCTFQKPGFL